jgi:hypothetical protein
MINLANQDTAAGAGTVIKESTGLCKSCNQWAELGNGLCMACWDAQADGELCLYRKKLQEGRPLTEVENQVWSLIQAGYNNPRISSQLGIPAKRLQRIIGCLNNKIVIPEGYDSRVWTATCACRDGLTSGHKMPPGK